MPESSILPPATNVSRGHTVDGGADKRRWRTNPRLFRPVNEHLFPFVSDLHASQGWFDLDAAAEDATIAPYFIAPEADTLSFSWLPHGILPCQEDGTGEPEDFDAARWVVWFNPPWGPDRPGSPGTGAYIDRMLSQIQAAQKVNLDLVVYTLVPTAPDTSWWRRAAESAYMDVTWLLPRMPFLHPDTRQVGNAPPGAGITLFVHHSNVLNDPNGLIKVGTFDMRADPAPGG